MWGQNKMDWYTGQWDLAVAGFPTQSDLKFLYDTSPKHNSETKNDLTSLSNHTHTHIRHHSHSHLLKFQFEVRELILGVAKLLGGLSILALQG